MAKVPLVVVFFVVAIAYAALGGLALSLLGGVLPRRTAALLVGFGWIFGWVWLIGALITGSSREGWRFLRGRIGYMGGMLIAVLPVALFPHPFLIAGGCILGIAFAIWCINGKAS